ncbi:DUF5908 family protein [Halalkalibaculum sp. DA3122]|uniref:DUF5908 family protein n=1 Tax=unclassified Halalkalibaculum TaxID=2964617 RepID=UPI003754480D
MPIEIRELVIKAVIDEEGQPDARRAENRDKQRQQIIRESVEQVLEIFEKRRER